MIPLPFIYIVMASVALSACKPVKVNEWWYNNEWDTTHTKNKVGKGGRI